MARRNRFIWIPGILGTSGWVGLVSPAHAGHYAAYTLDQPWGPASQNAVIPLNFQTFDTSLGVLTGVTISGNTSLTALLDVTNYNTFPVHVTSGYVSEPITITNGSGTYFSETVNQTVTAGNLSGNAAADTTIDNSGITTVFPGNTTNVAFAPAGINPSEFSTFESPGGTATVTIDVTTQDVAEGCNFSPNPPFQQFSQGDATVQGDVDVTYTYFVPEPSSLSLVIVGGSLALHRRRRSARH